jgi:hypothetical protein
MNTLEDLLELGKTETGQDALNHTLCILAGWEVDPEQEDGADMGTFNGHWDMIPDYTGDLNACREVEKVLRDAGIDAYERNLTEIMNQGARVCDFSVYPGDRMWHASALHRTIALILTLQKP